MRGRARGPCGQQPLLRLSWSNFFWSREEVISLLHHATKGVQVLALEWYHRQPHLVRAQTEDRGCRLDGDGVGLDEESAEERQQLVVKLAAPLPVTDREGVYHIRDGRRGDVGGDGDHTLPAQGHQRERHRVIPGEDGELLAAEALYVARHVHGEGRLLDPNDVRDLGQAGYGLGGDGHGRPAWDVVEDNGQFRALCYRGEVPVQSLLGRFVVVGGDLQRAVCALLLGHLRVLDRHVRAVRASTRDDGHPPVRDPDHGAYDEAVLLLGHGRGLARGPAGDKAVNAALDLELDHAFQGFDVHLPVAERCDEGRERAAKHLSPPTRNPCAKLSPLLLPFPPARRKSPVSPRSTRALWGYRPPRASRTSLRRSPDG